MCISSDYSKCTLRLNIVIAKLGFVGGHAIVCLTDIWRNLKRLTYIFTVPYTKTPKGQLVIPQFYKGEA